MHYLASGASTDAKFGLYRWDMGTTPGGPGPRFHKTISESFFVLSGTVRLFDGESVDRRFARRFGLAEMAAGKELTEEERTEFYLSHDNHWLCEKKESS